MPHLILKCPRDKRVALFLDDDRFLGFVSIYVKNGHLKLSFEMPSEVGIVREEAMSLAQLEMAEEALNGNS